MTEQKIVRIGELSIDEATGEIIDWPFGSADRLELLQRNHALAREQADLWDAQRGAYSRAIERLLDERGVRSFAGTDYKSVYYSGGENRTATVARMREALQWGVIHQEQYDSLLEYAAKDLDVKKIEQAVDRIITQEQADYLIARSPRAGHVRTNPLPQLAKG